ncbi:MAG: FG-GAP repeat protein [Planctomycetes bacterium]|nr:FG-GAP repeat protein [Planctomycetota bacterium]
MTHPASLLPVLALLLALPAPAQVVGGEWELLHQFEGQASLDFLGTVVAPAGDVDADGVPDLIFGTQYSAPGGLFQAGSALVHSGRTGAQLWRFDGAGAIDWLGRAVCGAGDVDGDGHDDLLVGASRTSPGGLLDAGSALVYSGATGAQIWRFDGREIFSAFGCSVAGPGDLDQDGTPDLVIGAYKDGPSNGYAGAITAYSGATGNPLWRADGVLGAEILGQALATLGDLDGDGVGDILSGSEFASPSGKSNAGSVTVFSGRTGARLLSLEGDMPYDAFGCSVSGAGDLDHDGAPDILVGAWGADPNGMLLAGSAYAISGATGARIHTWKGEAAGDQFGGAVAGCGDVDGDGMPDLLVAAKEAGPEGWLGSGSVTLWSGATGGLLRRFNGLAYGDNLGSSLAGPGDLDGDGLGELLIGARTADPQGRNAAGAVYLRSLDPILHPSASELPARLGAAVTLALDFPASEAGLAYAVLATRAGAGSCFRGGIRLPLNPDPLLDRMVAGWNPPLLRGGRGLLDAQGDGRATALGHPALSGAIGSAIHFAAVSFSPGLPQGRLASGARPVQLVP